MSGYEPGCEVPSDRESILQNTQKLQEIGAVMKIGVIAGLGVDAHSILNQELRFTRSSYQSVVIGPHRPMGKTESELVFFINALGVWVMPDEEN